MSNFSPTHYKHWYWPNRKEVGQVPGLIREGYLDKNETLRIIGTLGTIDFINKYENGLAYIDLISHTPDANILPSTVMDKIAFYFYAPFIWSVTKREQLLEMNLKTAWHVPTHDPYHRVSDRSNVCSLKLANHTSQEHFALLIPNR